MAVAAKWELPPELAGAVATLPPIQVDKLPAYDQDEGAEVAYGTVPHDYVPNDSDDLIRCLKDPLWRVCSGQLYKILVKKEDAELGTVIPFKPNRAQRRFMARLWHRNIILKARQLGFTTLICILWLDHALFNQDQRCGILAQDREAAEAIFRDKVKLAYERLPEALKACMPLKRDSASELLFAHNNSSIRVATSFRSGTNHRLHISEMGKIGAADPAKAEEVVTGSLPTVPTDGICVIESTAEGQEGEFYKLTTLAMAKAEKGQVLTEKDFRFHFFPWYQEPCYRLSGDVFIAPKDADYFQTVEGLTGTTLDREQRNWYVSTRDNEFSGDPEKMWREYPSTAAEAFQVSTEGVYYAVQLAQARKEGRIDAEVPYIVGAPVNTFWDIGNTDGTAIWFHQRIGYENRFINFIEGWGEPYSYFIEKMQAMGYVWGEHYLPHDAEHKRQQGARVVSPRDELQEFNIGGSWRIVSRVTEILNGIQSVRKHFNTYWFDKKCAPGIAHLMAYRKTWNKQRAGWNATVPSKVEGHSEAADAIRQHAQGYVAPRLVQGPKPARNWRTA